MKRLMIVAGCLFLSACGPKVSGYPTHLGIYCFDVRDTDKLVFTGKSRGGVGMVGRSNLAGHYPALVFTDDGTSNKIVLDLRKQYCVVVEQE
jgi:hypothetical protein